MKYAVNTDTPLRKIPPETQEIHLVRPIKKEKLSQLLKQCTALRTIYLSKSCDSRLPEKTRELIKERGIELVREDSRGRAINMDLKKLLNIVEMVKDGRSLREIESVSGIPKSTVHYIVKYAERTKLRDGRQIIYLK
ncbi:MAG: hypothetical protein V1672_00460 [Candidatus Diapherotrites archaeon]